MAKNHHAELLSGMFKDFNSSALEEIGQEAKTRYDLALKALKEGKQYPLQNKEAFDMLDSMRMLSWACLQAAIYSKGKGE